MKRIAHCALEGCRRGGLFDEFRADWSPEENHLPGWRNALGGGPRWKLFPTLYFDISAEGPFLERTSGHEVCLIAGDVLISDCTVRGKFRMLTERSRPTNTDDLWSFLGRVGPIVRMVDLRRYYQLCLEGYGRVVLYRRDDDERVELAAIDMSLSPTDYYELELTARGRKLTGKVNGRVVMEVEDDSIANGWPGVRCLAAARMQDIEVLVDEQDEVINDARRRQYQNELDEARAGVAQPRLWKHIAITPISELEGPLPGRVGGRPIFIFIGPDSTVMTDIEGKELWRYPAGLNNCCLADLDGPGKTRVAGTRDGQVIVLDAADGSELRRAKLPPNDPYRTNRCETIDSRFGGLTPVRLHIGGDTLGLILRMESGGGSRLFYAWDNMLQPLWESFTPRPPGAHVTHVTDILGRGADEIYTGMHVLDNEGKLVWSAEDAENFPPHGGDHMDVVVMDRMDPARPDRIYMATATGGDGLLVYDRETSKRLFRSAFGHVQSVVTGRFVPGRADKQFWAVTRWDTYGIACVIAPDGEVLSRFQLSFHSDNVRPANWAGLDEQLAFPNRDVKGEALGLVDWRGRLVAPIDPEEVNLGHYRSDGLGMLADVSGAATSDILIRTGDQIWIYTPAT